MKTTWKKLLLVAAAVVAAGYAYWRIGVPEHRVPVRSELVMLGDLDGDHRWTEGDLKLLDERGIQFRVTIPGTGVWADVDPARHHADRREPGPQRLEVRAAR